MYEEAVRQQREKEEARVQGVEEIRARQGWEAMRLAGDELGATLAQFDFEAVARMKEFNQQLYELARIMHQACVRALVGKPDARRRARV
jgi:hypothetical protein